MKPHKFVVNGFEMLEKNVIEFKGTASRVLVPKGWKKVALVRLE